MSLYQQLRQSLQLSEDKKASLIKSIKGRNSFFSEFNDARMKLAFSSFSKEMKHALFEVIYFLHVNDRRYENHTFPATRVEKVDGVRKEVKYQENINLFIPDAPAGVVGLKNLSPIFREEFESFIAKELSGRITPTDDFAPIFSISSLGSIGTVGHKKTASDLDLQVQYELSDFLLEEKELSEQNVVQYSHKLIKVFTHHHGVKMGYTAEQLKEQSKRTEAIKAGKIYFRKRYPLLFEWVVLQKEGFLREIKGDVQRSKDFAQEIIDLYKFHTQFIQKKKLQMKEKLLKKRVSRIQDYVQKKYPKAEVYLFAYSNDDYRKGNHGTTLDSKEASGSAYELILNYDTLMPGIQFTPMIPIHFLMPPAVNANRIQYESLVDYIRFHFTDLFDDYRSRLVDLGATPPLTTEYMVTHSGAIYWESFKASSGNLPKALLNLLRIEMLFDPRFNISIIELIKSPGKIDRYAGIADNQQDLDSVNYVEDDEEYDEDDYADDEDEDNGNDDFFADFGFAVGQDDDNDEIIGEDDSLEGVKIETLFALEDKFPLLLIDPWWLRYKALKIAFSPACKIVTDENELETLSRVIDLGFALHIKVSDIFGKRDGRKKDESHRERFMREYLAVTFPRSRRKNLEHIFQGEIKAVLDFERDLKFLFKRSMDRVKTLVDNLPGKDRSNQEEYRIWYYYYEKNFDPLPNVVHKDILSHLKVPRGRLQIGYRAGKWFFKSLQKRSQTSKYDTFGELDHLPDEVELFEHESFLHGIAHCIQNGYYGITKKGTLLESRTQMEFAVGKMEVGELSTDEFAFIRPDSVVRLTDKIDQAFPPQNYDYRDCLYKDKEITNIFICLNLLKYGQLSILYRDNMKLWYVDLFDHQQIEQKAEHYHDNYTELFSSPILHETLHSFFTEHKFKLTTRTKELLYCWVNPNSVETKHGADKTPQKEKDLAAEFKQTILNIHAS
jgi:hypothetical protein